MLKLRTIPCYIAGRACSKELQVAAVRMLVLLQAQQVCTTVLLLRARKQYLRNLDYINHLWDTSWDHKWMIYSQLIDIYSHQG